MKISDIITFSFRQELERIRREEAGRAARGLIVYPDGRLAERHLSWQSQFCRACVSTGYLTQQQMEHAARKYWLGLSRDGGVIFWQIDQLGQVADGKVMYYRPDCHRDHGHAPTWVSNELKRFYQPPVDIASTRCLFGLHLLPQALQCGQAACIAVVEAEKTAVILSELYPRQLWMATGGLNELSEGKLFPLRHQQVILFPDTDEDCQTYARWYQVARRFRKLHGSRITVSTLLERQATRDQKRRKIDLVDFLFEDRRSQ